MSPRAVIRNAIASVLAVALLVSGGSQASVLFRCSLTGGLYATCCCASDERPEASGAHGCCGSDDAPPPTGPMAQGRCCDEVHVAGATTLSEPAPHRAPAPLLAVVREAPARELTGCAVTTARAQDFSRPAVGPPTSVLTRSYRC